MPIPPTPERLIHIPGMRVLGTKEALERIDKFLRQVPGLTCIIVLGQQGDSQNIGCRRSTNITDDQTREMLRRALHLLEEKQRSQVQPISPT